MQKLLREIKRELKTAKHCAVYEEELTRVWPDDGNRREPKVRRFAEEHGFRLRFYRDGLCAIFDREPAERSEEQFFQQSIRRNALCVNGRQFVQLGVKRAQLGRAVLCTPPQ